MPILEKAPFFVSWPPDGSFFKDKGLQNIQKIPWPGKIDKMRRQHLDMGEGQIYLSFDSAIRAWRAEPESDKSLNNRKKSGMAKNLSAGAARHHGIS